MKVENQRKQLKKEVKFIHESVVHILKRHRLDKITREDMNQEMTRVTKDLSDLIRKHCGVRKQKAKRLNINHYLFLMSKPLKLFFRATLALDGRSFPLLYRGIVSSRAIPTLIGLVGCSDGTTKHVKDLLPAAYDTNNLMARKLNVPIFTAIIHKYRIRPDIKVEDKEKYMQLTLEEHAKLQQLKHQLSSPPLKLLAVVTE